MKSIIKPYFRLSIMIGMLLMAFLFYGNSWIVPMVEICDNGIDDDNDGLIDINDDGCLCDESDLVSLIPNPSFEDRTCCPQSRSELNCAETWIQASEPTTDFLHTCGWMGWPNLEPPLPFPDGEGCVGFRDGRSFNGNSEKTWKEYVGACLNEPLRVGNQYTFEFFIGFTNPINSPPLNISFFGTTNCENLPFGIGNNELGCPTNGPNWQFLAATDVRGSNWVKTRLTITPNQDIYAIAIGPPCRLTTHDVNLYYFIDNLVLADSKFFNVEIIEGGSVCNEAFYLSVPEKENARYQWYKDGIAIASATEHVYVPGEEEGRYELMYFFDDLCKLSEPYEYLIPVRSERKVVTICDEDVYLINGLMIDKAGIYTDTLVALDGCDSILTIDLNVQSNVSSDKLIKIFPDEFVTVGDFKFTEKGKYEVPLRTQFNCDSLVNLEVEFYKLFIPNVFSPNDDGINDLLEIQNFDQEIRLQHFRIFNRWGEEIFDVNVDFQDINPAWDGTQNDRIAENGVYTYQVILLIQDKRKKILTGSVSLIR